MTARSAGVRSQLSFRCGDTVRGSLRSILSTQWSVPREMLVEPTSCPPTHVCRQHLALQTTLCSCPCVRPSWHIYLHVHVGALYLKPNPLSFSKKGGVTHVIRQHCAVRQVTAIGRCHCESYSWLCLRSASLYVSLRSPSSLLCVQTGVQEPHSVFVCTQIFGLLCSGNSSI